MAPFVPASTAAWRHSSGHERRKSTAANARSASCVQWRIVCERKVSTATGFASFMLLYAASAWDRALLSGDISVAISPWNSSTLMLERSERGPLRRLAALAARRPRLPGGLGCPAASLCPRLALGWPQRHGTRTGDGDDGFKAGRSSAHTAELNSTAHLHAPSYLSHSRFGAGIVC